jgi:hypothetical protein
MSKINQIQNAILELDGGAFQKLADAYLLKKGYSVSSVNSIGSVIGKNKTKIGTPDTLITLLNGKYVFAEYTTQESKVFKKFSDDIDKCLNTDKTGIATDKIEEIVLCYTSELLPIEIEQLRQKCENVEINFNQYGMSTISYDLLEKYPQLAEEFLNISVDTGQIVELSSFIALYSKNKLATTLETNLYFREEYKRKTFDILNTNNLVIISGQAGVGKTRFAIECFKDFMSSNSSYKGYCILVVIKSR